MFLPVEYNKIYHWQPSPECWDHFKEDLSYCKKWSKILMKEKQGIHNSLKENAMDLLMFTLIIVTFILANRSFKIGKI